MPRFPQGSLHTWSLLAALMLHTASPATANDDDAHFLTLTPQSELAAYRASPTRCQGPHADQAAEVAITRFHAWRIATNLHKTPPKGAFADAEQALKYLYDKLGCRDGLIAYRHGGVLRLRKDFAQAIVVIDAALPDIEKNYRRHLRHALFTLGQASVSADRSDTAIGYYQRLLAEAPQETGARLNLANQLIRQSRFIEARAQIEQAQKAGLNEYGQAQAMRLLGSLPKAE